MNEIATTKFISEPTECPSCGSSVEKVGDQLFCRNVECSAQVYKKIEHFAKVLGIKGLGPRTIEKLQLQNITELFYLDKEEVQKVLGEKVALKVLNEIEKAKSAELSTVLESFSIPLIGGTASKKLAAVISSIEEITQDTCKNAGLGEKATTNILTWKNIEYNELVEFLPFTYSDNIKQQNTTGDTVCITGKLSSYKKKSDAYALLEAAGYVIVESVTKQLKYLVDETGGNSSKKEKAIQYGVTIITNINDLLKVDNDRNKQEME